MYTNLKLCPSTYNFTIMQVWRKNSHLTIIIVCFVWFCIYTTDIMLDGDQNIALYTLSRYIL